MPRIAIRRSTLALVLSTTAAVVGVGLGADVGLAGAAPSTQDSAPSTQGSATVTQAARPGISPRIIRAEDVSVRRAGHRRWQWLQRRTPETPRMIGYRLAARRGWTGEQWTCLDELWTRESRWHVHVTNESSGAYGIPQALPAEKMAAAGGGWRDSATIQVSWGLSYIAANYGSPCNAWDHSEGHGYY